MLEAPAHAFMPHVEGYTELASITLARKIDDINARHAAETAKSANLTLAMVFVAVSAISFVSLYAAAAVAKQGAENWRNTRIANVQP